MPVEKGVRQMKIDLLDRICIGAVIYRIEIAYLGFAFGKNKSTLSMITNCKILYLKRWNLRPKISLVPR